MRSKQHDRTPEAVHFLTRIHAAASKEDRELIEVSINALLFIGSTGQRYAFMDFVASRASNAPPPVVAAFKNREEAKAWLHGQQEPPDSTLVLIGDQYHTVVFLRDQDHRRLLPHSVIEFHLGRLKRAGLPPVVASFQSREEAESWFAHQPEPPPQARVTIAGEDYLAVFHRNVGHRALYPFSLALGIEQM